LNYILGSNYYSIQISQPPLRSDYGRFKQTPNNHTSRKETDLIEPFKIILLLHSASYHQSYPNTVHPPNVRMEQEIINIKKPGPLKPVD